MAATYNPTLPETRDHLRFALGDTDVPDGALLPDETYDAAIAAADDWRLAGAQLAAGLAARFALEPDSITIPGEISVSWRSRIDTWTRLATGWLAEVAAVTASGLTSVAAVRDDWTEPEYVYRPWDPYYSGTGG